MTSRVCISRVLKRSSLAIIYLSTSLYIPACISIYLSSIYLSIYHLSTYLPTYLPPYLSTSGGLSPSLTPREPSKPPPRPFLQPRTCHLFPCIPACPRPHAAPPPQVSAWRPQSPHPPAEGEGQRPRGGAGLSGDAGWGSPRRALTLPAVGAATRSTSWSRSSSAGGLGAVPARIVGVHSEPRRVQGPAGSRATACPARRGWRGPAVKAGLASPPGAGFVGLSLPTEASREGRSGLGPAPVPLPADSPGDVPPTQEACQEAREGCAPAAQVGAGPG